MGSGDGLDVRGLCALRALGQLVADALAFLQAAESLAVDRGGVRKDIGAAIFRRDESEALGVIEPFHGTGRHSSGVSLVWVRVEVVVCAWRTGGVCKDAAALTITRVPDDHPRARQITHEPIRRS